MTSFFTGHILGPHRGTVPFSKHHEQRAEEWVRERARSLRWISIQLEPSDSPRCPVCWQWQIFSCSWGPASFCPACFPCTPTSLFLNPDRSDQYRIYIFTVYWPAANTWGLTLLRREMRMDKRRKRLKREQEKINLCQSWRLPSEEDKYIEGTMKGIIKVFITTD